MHHYALMGALPSVELQETKEGKDGRGRERRRSRRGKAEEEEGAGTRKGSLLSSGIQNCKPRQLECILIKETDLFIQPAPFMLIMTNVVLALLAFPV